MTELRSPRSSLRLTPTTAGLAASFTCPETDWLDEACEAVELVASTPHVAIPSATDVARTSEGLSLVYQVRPGAVPVDGTVASLGALADVADAVAAITRASSRFPLGPFEPWLFARTPDGAGQLVAGGLWGVAYALDRGTRGARMLARHFVESPDTIVGSRTAATETFYLAYAIHRLFAGAEPFPTGDSFAYLTAVRERAARSLGAMRPDLPGGLVRLIDAALISAPAERASPGAFAAALRALV